MSITQTIILASGSPRRCELLKALKLPFTIHTADIDETPLPDETPSALVCRLSLAKAKAVAKYYRDAIVIAADTIVVLDGQILGKPAHSAEAYHMLNQLKGRDHDVYSAVTLRHSRTEETATKLNKTTVTMRPYTKAEIEAYISSGDSMDKAGAYAIQNAEFAPVAKISGCYAGVMGLPLGDLVDGLKRFGIMVNHPGERCTNHTGQPCCLFSL